MKKATMSIVLGLMLVLTLAAVSATPSPSTTIIAGKIYNSDYTDIEAGADVIVTCGTLAGNVQTTLSDPDGAYKVQYQGILNCTVNDQLLVEASKGSLTGSSGTHTIKNTGCTSADNCLINVFSGVDVAVVNVPLVPEFGFFIGLTTALAAVGVFFIVRRK